MLSLSVDSITIKYGKKHIVDEVSFSGNAPLLITVVGVNGVGKSSLLRAISGKKWQGTGNITLNNNGVVLPLSSSSQSVSALDPLPGAKLLACELLSLTKMSQENQKVLSSLKIEHLLDRDIFTLSSGELQRVLLASSLMHSSLLLLIDEPTSFSDPASTLLIWQTLKNLTNSRGSITICASHDLTSALTYSDLVLILYQKKMLACLSPKDGTILSYLTQAFDTPFTLLRDGDRIAVLASSEQIT